MHIAKAKGSFLDDGDVLADQAMVDPKPPKKALEQTATVLAHASMAYQAVDQASIYRCMFRRAGDRQHFEGHLVVIPGGVPVDCDIED